MAAGPLSVDVRSFQVGFGDCFLVSFRYERRTRHMLVDFGSTDLPTTRGKGSPGATASVEEHLTRVAREIAAVCGRDGLAVLVASHRHADHISGFSTTGRGGGPGAIIRALRPRVVIQPWTEDPRAARDARRATTESERAYVRGLGAMNAIAEEMVRRSAAPVRGLSQRALSQLGFLGRTNVANRSAVENLQAMGRAPGARAVWARHGTDLRLGRILPGVRVDVLGPPDLTQTEAIRRMRSADAAEFWHLASVAMTAGRGRPSGRRRAAALPAEVRWFCDRLEKADSAHLLEIVRQLDRELNNTSLILLIEACGRRLLFPGDAQLEPWLYALEDAKDAPTTRERLAGVDVYKVGHHGSLNATPRRTLWSLFRKRGRPGRDRLHSLLSTKAGKHGDPRSATEVPRRTLVEALERETILSDTSKLSTSGDAVRCHLLRVTADSIEREVVQPPGRGGSSSRRPAGAPRRGPRGGPR
jgi:hypothetical protein